MVMDIQGFRTWLWLWLWLSDRSGGYGYWLSITCSSRTKQDGEREEALFRLSSVEARLYIYLLDGFEINFWFPHSKVVAIVLLARKRPAYDSFSY